MHLFYVVTTFLKRHLAPEAVGDILELPVLRLAIETLVCRRALQWSQMADIRTYLDIVEIRLSHLRCHAQASTIPCHLIFRMRLVNILCQTVDGLRIRVTSIKAKQVISVPKRSTKSSSAAVVRGIPISSQR